MEKTEMPLFHILIDDNLDDIVETLERMKNEEVNYYYDFFDHRLYSDTITLESAYNEVYGMTREEYRKKLKERLVVYKQKQKENSERRHQEYLEEKAKIYEKARTIIKEDFMPLFDEVLELLAPVCISLSTNSDIQLFFDLIEELNKDDYSLEKAKDIFSRIYVNRYTITNFSLLKCIKKMAVHGDALYNELFDEEKEIEYKKDQQKNRENPSSLENNLNNLLKNCQYKKSELTEEEQLTEYDRYITTRCLMGHALMKSMDSKKK